MLTITSQKKLFTYTCTVDGETLVEGNEAIGTSSTAPHILADVESADMAVDDDGKVRVTGRCVTRVPWRCVHQPLCDISTWSPYRAKHV